MSTLLVYLLKITLVIKFLDIWFMGKFEAYGNFLSDKVTDIVIHNNQSNITNNSKIKIRKIVL